MDTTFFKKLLILTCLFASMNIFCSSERRKGGDAKGAESSPLAGGGSGAAMPSAEEIEEKK